MNVSPGNQKQQCPSFRVPLSASGVHPDWNLSSRYTERLGCVDEDYPRSC
jgi:hypothetical protein